MAYENLAEAANATPKTAKAVIPPDPEERLEDYMMEMNENASRLEAEARDLEDRVLLLRARAVGLRRGAEGVREALHVFKKEMEARSAFMANRDGEDVPVEARGDRSYGELARDLTRRNHG